MFKGQNIVTVFLIFKIRYYTKDSFFKLMLNYYNSFKIISSSSNYFPNNKKRKNFIMYLVSISKQSYFRMKSNILRLCNQ